MSTYISNPNDQLGIQPIVALRAPRTTDKAEIGTLWIDKPNNDVYAITSIVNNSATWINCGGGSGSFAALTVNPGNATITAGDLIVTAGDIVATAIGRGVVQSSATGVLSSSMGTDGQILVAATGLSASWATITSATLNITGGAGTLQIEYPGGTAATFVTDAGGPVSPLLGATTVEGYDANITTDGATANTVKIRLADSVTTVAALTAGVNLGMNSGICTITSDNNAANAIYLHANGGVNETINLHADQGTSVGSVTLQSDLGGLTLSSGLASTDAINLTATNGGIDMDSALQTNITSTENAATAIYVHTTAGGMELRADGVAGQDLTLQASSSINLLSTENAAQSIYLRANGGANETIDIYADQGTAVTSVNIHSDVGGLTLASGLASNDAINLTAASGGLDVDAAMQINVTSTQAAANSIVLNASNAAGGLDIDYGTGGCTIDGANGAFTLQTGTGTISIGEDLVQHIIGIGNATGDTSIDLTSGTGGITLASTGVGDITIDSDDTLLLDADGVLELNSSGGVIGIGTDNDAQNINIGTGASERIITLGNVTNATSVVVNVGTGNADFGVSATDHSTRIGGTTGTSAFTASAGTGAWTATAGGAFDVNAVGAITIDSSGSTIGIGTDAVAQNMNIGTGAAARIITVGNNNGATSVVVDVGTGNLDLGVTATAHTVRVGSVTTTSATLIQSGTGDVTLDSTGDIALNADGQILANKSVELTTAGTGFFLQEGPRILAGSGTPHGAITAPKGSLYLNTAGSGVGDRAYINTDSGTTWTALTTAA